MSNTSFKEQQVTIHVPELINKPRRCFKTMLNIILGTKECKAYKKYISYYKSLEYEQKRCFTLYMRLWRRQVDMHQDFNNLHGINDLGMISLLLRVAKGITNHPTHRFKDCHLLDGCHRDSEGYPVIHVTSLVFMLKYKSQGKRVYATGKKVTSTVHRLMTCLSSSKLISKDRRWQSSHRCWRQGQTCINPKHLIVRTDAENKDMNGCKYGCKAYCPHNPKCIFVSQTGMFQPCRNAHEPVSPHNCPHEQSCFSYLSDINKETT